MIRPVRQKRSSIARRRPTLESLELRPLLSTVYPWDLPDPFAGGDPAAEYTWSEPEGTPAESETGGGEVSEMMMVADDQIETIPAHQSRVTQALDSLVITFPTRVDYYWMPGTIRLDRIQPDGTTVPYLYDWDLAYPSFDETGTVATLTLSQTLEPGQYRLVLMAWSDASMITGDGLWDFTQDLALADFEVTAQPMTDLGVIGPKVVTVKGAIDSSETPEGIYYKFALAPGQFWRLGLQLDAESLGSGLQGMISLYDESRNLIAQVGGAGRPISPDDPYLFKGLNPGTYYIQIDRTNSLPENFGSFNLDLVADPADTPTKVVGYTLYWADPNDSTPTGITLAFSGAINPWSLIDPVTKQVMLSVVNQDGRTWSLVLSNYDEENCEITFLFSEPLPAGSYRLLNPMTGGLTDLADLPVVSAAANNVLAKWDVADRVTPPSENDLGVLRPVRLRAVFSEMQGDLITYRVVIPAEGFVSIYIWNRAEGAMITLTNVNTGESYVGFGDDKSWTKDSVLLQPGIYTLTISSPNDLNEALVWTIKFSNLEPADIINNGVGQTPAFTLRLLQRYENPPQIPSPAPGPGVTPIYPAPNPGTTPPGATNPAPAQPGDSGTPASSIGPIVSIEANLLGRPSSSGSTTNEAMAMSQAGPLSLNNATSVLLASLRAGGVSGPLPYDAPPTNQAAETTGTDRALADDWIVDASAESEKQSRGEADANALANADRASGLAAYIASWFSGGAQSPSAADSLETDPELTVATGPAQRDGSEDEVESDRVVHADLGLPTAVVLSSLAAVRLRQLTKRWWRSRTPSISPLPARGMHSRPATRLTRVELR